MGKTAADFFARVGAGAGPLALIAVPKCPLCLVALFGTAGLAVTSAPILSGVAVALAAVWIGAMCSLARSPLAGLAAAAPSAGLALSGRLLDLPALGWCGAALMIVLAVYHFAPRRACCATDRPIHRT